MRPRLTFALCTGLAGAVACAPTPPPEPLFNVSATQVHDHAPLATLERTDCYGTCPVYKLTVFRDGMIEYVGTRYVKVTGKAVGQISEAQVDKLEDLFLKYQYLQFKTAYHGRQVTDMPTVNTSYTPAGGTTKIVKHYLGDDNAPVALNRIEHSIDKLVHVERWIGTESEREQLH
jgi:hypothetical protein